MWVQYSELYVAGGDMQFPHMYMLVCEKVVLVRKTMRVFLRSLFSYQDDPPCATTGLRRDPEGRIGVIYVCSNLANSFLAVRSAFTHGALGPYGRTTQAPARP